MKYISLLVTLFFISCGNGGNTSSSPTAKKIQKEADPIKIENVIDGQYLAKMLPINSHLSGNISGSMTVSIDKNELVGDVLFFGNELSTANIALEQTIHAGERCPNLNDDQNEDGILDEAETIAVIGQILIPLDGDLNSQWLGANSYPLSDSFGSYYYNQVASWDKTLDDLWDEDINDQDQLLKIPARTLPEFEGRIAMIRGISSKINLPETASKLSSKEMHSTLPVLCGIFRKIKRAPGRRNIETYPVPELSGDNPEDNTVNPSSPPQTGESSGPIINYGD
jgi:hypothetical protein